MSDESTHFVVDVVAPDFEHETLAVSWEWDVPPGFQMISQVSERAPRLIVTIERLGGSEPGSE